MADIEVLSVAALLENLPGEGLVRGQRARLLDLFQRVHGDRLHYNFAGEDSRNEDQTGDSDVRPHHHERGRARTRAKSGAGEGDSQRAQVQGNLGAGAV